MRTALVLPLALLVLSACQSNKDAAAGRADAAPGASALASASRLAPSPSAIPAPADVAAPPADAQKTDDGLAYKVLTAATGTEHPGSHDKVTVQYTGWTKDGHMFDSSVARGQPASFPVDGVIPGWTEVLQLMATGEKVRVWIPAKLAYGDTPMRPGAPAGDLTFDVELLDFQKAPPPPAVPADVKAPPANAKKTADGLAYRLLKAGTGKDSPKPTDVVTVNYTGWTTDGKMFDSSVVRGRPASFPVTGVIKGWTEGLQLMKVGDQMRFWIPAALAYGDKPTRPGAPAGMLVFDVELLGMHPGGAMPPRMMPR